MPEVRTVFQEIKRPLDEVAVHGHLVVTPEQYSQILKILLPSRTEGSLDEPLILMGAFRIDDAFNVLRLNVHMEDSPTVKSGGTKTIHIEMDQEWVPVGPPKYLRAAVSSNLRRINSVMSKIEAVGATGKFYCDVDWNFQPSEAEPMISLPYPYPIPGETTLTTVRGLQFSSTDGSTIMDIQRSVSGRLNVSVRIEIQAKLTSQLIQQAVTKARPMLNNLIRLSGAQ